MSTVDLAIVTNGSVVLNHVREQTRNLVVEQVACDDGRRNRRALKLATIQSSHGNGFWKEVVFHFAMDDNGGGDARGFLLRHRDRILRVRLLC